MLADLTAKEASDRGFWLFRVTHGCPSRLNAVPDPMEALVTFATVACEKIRGRNLAASGVWVWVDGNPRKGDGFHVSRAIPLPFPTRDTRDVLLAVR